MDSRPSEALHLADSISTTVKMLVVGPFAVGKTTFVDTLSEIRPLSTEEVMTQAGEQVDDPGGVPGKNTTTVALDFGRLTLNNRMVLYLFGAPGQRRFLPLWNDLTHGALGALVLVDAGRIEASFEIMDILEEYGLCYAVAVNDFGAVDPPRHDELREALDLLPEIPLVTCDARDPDSSKSALIALTRYLLTPAAQESS